MAKIEKLPSGTYRTRIYDKRTGKQKSITAPTRAELKQLAIEYEANIDRETSGNLTIGEAIDAYINNRSAVLSPSTLRSYRQFQGCYYADIENYSVDSIKSEDIQKFVNNLARQLSPKTVRNVYGFLISSISAVNPDKHIKVTLPQKKVIQRHIPTDKDIQALIDLANPEMKKAIMLAAFGTMRRSEICALTYDDIDGNVIHVHRNMVKGIDGWIVKNIPKTNSSDRYIEYPAAIIEKLCDRNKGNVVDMLPQSVTDNFYDMRHKLGLSCRFHDLRHYAASIMHALGIPDQYIMERGGWSSDTVLKSVYRNVLDDKQNEFTELINSYTSQNFK